jgi:hypothetical protein
LDGITREEILNKDNEEIIPYKKISHLINGWIDHGDIKIPKISGELTIKDKLGNVGVRLGIKRDNHKIPTGLYALGNPDKKSPLIATCNYKLTFYILRKDMEDMNAWILVLDTNGVNVWCASGKGTFSSRELMYQMNKWKVKEITGINKVILPQLGATSMEPHLVKKIMNIDIIYGPVRSSDFKKFVSEGKASNEMRKVNFKLKDRIVLTTVEIVQNIEFWIGAFIICALFTITGSEVFGFYKVFIMAMPTLIGLFMATIVFHVFLPILPGKYFSLKGLLLGLLPAAMVLLKPEMFYLKKEYAFLVGYAILILVMTSWITFKFTGSTTYTSMSGVEIETKKIMPVIKIAVYTGFALIATGMVVSYGL